MFPNDLKKGVDNGMLATTFLNSDRTENNNSPYSSQFFPGFEEPSAYLKSKTFDLVWIANEDYTCWQETMQLRQRYESSHQDIFASLKFGSLEESTEKAFEIVKRTLLELTDTIDFQKIEPGHGIGHLSRDIIHALVLAKQLKMNPAEAYIGIIAGALHDILGCTVVERYKDKNRTVRHGEAGGLIFREIATKIGVSDEESLLVYYAIAAHSHNLVEETLNYPDGSTRIIKPYLDTFEDGRPNMAIFLPRWVDRLDSNGPCYVGRHYLTLANEHFDRSENGWYRCEYAMQMRPLLRDQTAISADPNGRTMLEHLLMYANSQRDDSLYGRYDYGEMRHTRDYYRKQLLKILNAATMPILLSHKEEQKLLEDFTAWVWEHIEPTANGKAAANKLKEMFLLLDRDTKVCWHSVFKATLDKYQKWANRTLKQISKVSESLLAFPIIGDIRPILGDTKG